MSLNHNKYNLSQLFLDRIIGLTPTRMLNFPNIRDGLIKMIQIQYTYFYTDKISLYLHV